MEAEALLGSDHEANDGAAIVADKIHGAVEALPPQFGDQWERAFQASASAFSGKSPYFLDPRKVLQERHGRLFHEDVNLGRGPVLAKRPESGHHDGDITQLLELDGQDFHGTKRGSKIPLRRNGHRSRTPPGSHGVASNGSS